VRTMIARGWSNTPSHWYRAIIGEPPTVEFELSVIIHRSPVVDFISDVSEKVADQVISLFGGSVTDSLSEMHERQSADLCDWNYTREERRRYAGIMARNDGAESILAGVDMYSRQYGRQRTCVTAGHVCARGNGTIPRLIRRYLADRDFARRLIEVCAAATPGRMERESRWVQMCTETAVQAKEAVQAESARRATARKEKEKAAREKELKTDAGAGEVCRRCDFPQPSCRACTTALKCIDALDYDSAQEEIRGWRDRGISWGELAEDKKLFSLYSTSVDVSGEKVDIRRAPYSDNMSMSLSRRIASGRAAATELMRAALRRIVMHRRVR